MKYAIPGRPEAAYEIGDTVKLFTGVFGEVTQRRRDKAKRVVVLKLPDGTCVEVPEHYIVGVKYP